MGRATPSGAASRQMDLPHVEDQGSSEVGSGDSITRFSCGYAPCLAEEGEDSCMVVMVPICNRCHCPGGSAFLGEEEPDCPCILPS